MSFELFLPLVCLYKAFLFLLVFILSTYSGDVGDAVTHISPVNILMKHSYKNNKICALKMYLSFSRFLMCDWEVRFVSSFLLEKFIVFSFYFDVLKNVLRLTYKSSK